MNSPSQVSVETPAAVGLCAERLKRLGAVLQAEIDAGKLPGAVVTISRRGRLAFQAALGRLDPHRDQAMTTDAIFRIYSMTKPIVSVAVMSLVEQGRLLLTHPVGRYLPEFAALNVAVEDASPVKARRGITVHDLLRHTAGLTYEFMGATPLHQQYQAMRLFGRGYTNTDFTKQLASLPLQREPGTAWTYSHATDVLGRLIEVISGQSLGDFLRQTIFEPLGMSETAFHVEAAQHHRIAEPYPVDPDAGVPIRVFDVRTPAPQEMGGAGLTSTAADYARFMDMMLGGGAAHGVRILSPQTVRLMTSDHLGDLPIADELLGTGHGFGLGFAVRLQDGLVPGAGSAGMYYWAGLAGTSFFIDPKEQLHAQLLIQQPGRRDHYRALFRELVYAALLD